AAVHLARPAWPAAQPAAGTGIGSAAGRRRALAGPSLARPLPPRNARTAARRTRCPLLTRRGAARRASHHRPDAMTRRPLDFLAPFVFLAGLLVVGWIGAGYLGSNLLGIAVVGLIVACYAAGALELHRYRQGSASLARALDDADADAAAGDLAGWLDR